MIATSDNFSPHSRPEEFPGRAVVAGIGGAGWIGARLMVGRATPCAPHLVAMNGLQRTARPISALGFHVVAAFLLELNINFDTA